MLKASLNTRIQLWVCRDTQQIQSNGQPGIGVMANTASWSAIPSATQAQRLVLRSPQGFGSLFYPLESDECPQFGLCSDNTRWVGWPDTAPAVTFLGTEWSVCPQLCSSPRLQRLTSFTPGR